MNYYIDTSSLMKLYHKEDGTQNIINLYNSDSNIIISELAKIEFISTIHRKYREEEITLDTLQEFQR